MDRETGPGRSQPTYEELKPARGGAGIVFSIRSQPTYEELKLDGKDKRVRMEKSSQPTYEELKQHAILPPFSLVRVPSLPMRN